MKTLGNFSDKQEVLARVARVRVDSPRVWGKMSAPQMVCHLRDSFRSKLGDGSVRPADTFFTRTLMKWGALWVPLRWPQGIKTVPELDQKIGGTPPVDFEADRQELIGLAEQFAGKPGFLATARHLFFGKMSTGEWMRWAYLHMDHHLRQFGC